MAGAALGAPPAHFAWQAQHLEHLHRGPRKSATIDDFGHRLVLRGRRSTWSTSGSFCLASAALGTPQGTTHEPVHLGTGSLNLILFAVIK